MTVFRHLFVFVVPVVLLACTSVSDRSQKTLYQCGVQDVTVDAHGETALVSMRGEQQTLTQTPAASGARYVSTDERTQFWNKGHEAAIIWQDETLPRCVEQQTLPRDIAFSGNEPFWVMTLNDNHVSFTTPNSEQEYAAEAASRNDKEGWVIALLTGAEQIGQLHVKESICYDSMSGKAFPYTVVLQLGDEQHQGCGGETTQLIQGQPWQLAAMSDFSGSLLDKPALQFLTEGRLVGTDGCNQFFGHYSVEGEIPRLNIQGATKRMCTQDTMAVAQKFVENLNNTTKIDIKEDKLVLKVNSGQQLTFAPKY